MSEQNQYTKQLEKLISKTLLPVYEQHCELHGLNIYDSGIPPELLQTLKRNSKPVAALLREKQSGS